MKRMSYANIELTYISSKNKASRRIVAHHLGIHMSYRGIFSIAYKLKAFITRAKGGIHDDNHFDGRLLELASTLHKSSDCLKFGDILLTFNSSKNAIDY